MVGIKNYINLNFKLNKILSKINIVPNLLFYFIILLLLQ